MYLIPKTYISLFTTLSLLFLGCETSSDTNASDSNTSSSTSSSVPINSSASSDTNSSSSTVSSSSISSESQSSLISSSSSSEAFSNRGNPSFELEINDENITLYYGENTQLIDTNIVTRWKIIDEPLSIRFDLYGWYVVAGPVGASYFPYGVSEDAKTLYLNALPGIPIIDNTGHLDDAIYTWNIYEYLNTDENGCYNFIHLQGESVGDMLTWCLDES